MNKSTTTKRDMSEIATIASYKSNDDNSSDRYRPSPSQDGYSDDDTISEQGKISNYRTKYRPMYMAYGAETEPPPPEVDEEDTSVTNFYGYLNSIHQSANKKAKTFHSLAAALPAPNTFSATNSNKHVVETSWSLSWPPYLLMARLIIVIMTYSLRYAHKATEWSTPKASALAYYFFKLLQMKLEHGVCIANWPALIFELAMTALMYCAYIILLTIKLSIKFCITPVWNKPYHA